LHLVGYETVQVFAVYLVERTKEKTMTISSAIHHSSTQIDSHPEATRYLVPVGRLLFAAIFLLSVPEHFAHSTIDFAASAGVPAANILVPLSGVLEGIGALSVLLGYRARIGGLLLALFLVPVTIAMHKFWGIDDPMKAHMQQINFMKNVALLGGTFLLMHFGAGPVSIDSRTAR
jgi:putative oxidoreductase